MRHDEVKFVDEINGADSGDDDEMMIYRALDHSPCPSRTHWAQRGWP